MHSYKITWSFYSSNLSWASTICRASQVALAVKNPPAGAGDLRAVGLIPGPEDPRRRAWQLAPVFLPGVSHGQRNLAGCSPWGHKEADRTERTQAQTPLSCTNPYPIPHPPGAAQGWETQKPRAHSHSGLASTLVLFWMSRSAPLCSDNFAGFLFVTKSKCIHS